MADGWWLACALEQVPSPGLSFSGIVGSGKRGRNMKTGKASLSTIVQLKFKFKW